jgi:outer membrane protein assembly factor BamA
MKAHRFYHLRILIASIIFLLLILPTTLVAKKPTDTGITIEKIECEGNRYTTCDFIVGQTALNENEPLDEDKVKEAKLRLMLLGYFEEVTIRLEKGSEFGKAKMVITLKERSAFSFYGSLGVISPLDSPYVTSDFIGAHRRLTGHGDPLSLRLRTNYGTIYYDTSPSQDNLLRSSTNASKAHELMARLEYTRPNFFTPRLSLTGGLGA